MSAMSLQEWMLQPIVTVSANDYATAALELMRNRGVSRVFVLDRDEIAGVVYARDLERLSETALRDCDVREAMNRNLQVIGPEFSPDEAERLINRKGLSCLVVREGRSIRGVITPEALPRKSNRYATQPRLCR